MKHGVLKFEVFNLNTRENMMDFVNLSKIISANNDEDVWLEIQSYRDDKHVQEFMELITPGSIVTFGDFSKLEEVS